jgi:uncharacterized membrane protein YhaH (DUF805 family)
MILLRHYAINTPDIRAQVALYSGEIMENIKGLIGLLLIAFVIVGLWKTFEKAGKPGWGALIPIFNVYLLLKIAGRPGWWLLLTLIPLVNLVIMIIVAIDVAKAFGHGVGYALGLTFFPMVFYPMLGFGQDTSKA